MIVSKSGSYKDLKGRYKTFVDVTPSSGNLRKESGDFSLVFIVRAMTEGLIIKIVIRDERKESQV